MKLFMFSILDAKVGAFAPPFYARSLGEAVRTVTDTLLADSQLSRHPEDFHLYELGSFEDQSATFELAQPTSRGNLTQFMPRPKVTPLEEAIQRAKPNGKVVAEPRLHGDGYASN